MCASKKSVMRSVLLFTLVIFLLSAGLVQGVFATSEEELQMAPLNPDFLEYLKELDENDIGVQTEEGHKLGLIPPPVKREHIWETEDDFSALSLPLSYDLRNLNRVTPVKNQSPYGSCWTFATYGSLESYLLKAGSSNNFSENNLMLLHGFDYGPDDGGQYLMSTAYLSRWSGPVLESQDPYNTSATRGLSPARHVQKVEFIPRNENAIKQKIMNDGALYTAMYYHQDPYGTSALEGQGEQLQSNYYNSSTNAYYYDGTQGINHGVTLVGWDDNYSRNNFSRTPPGDGAWIVKNSWGTDWGDNGYFYFSYHDTHSGNTTVAFNNAEPTTNYDRIYQYDWLGNVSDFGYENNTAVGANIFTAQASENLAAVSTYALAPNTSYEIMVYTGVDPGQPRSGTLQLTQTGTVSNAGYYTIALNNNVALTSGQRFSVVIEYTTPGYGLPVPVETRISRHSSNASINPGESFISPDGNNWVDLGAHSTPANVCIKAFTKGAADPDPDPTPPPGPEGVTLSASVASPSLPGQRVTFTANTTGMTNPILQFWYQSSGGKWTKYGGMTDINYFSYNFPSTWSGNIGVQALGEGSSTVHTDRISHRASVPPVQSVTLSASPYGQAKPYQTVTLTAHAVGGHNPEYAFYYRIPGKTGWRWIYGYSQYNSINVHANGEFNPQIGVIARSSGSKSSYEDLHYIDYLFHWGASGLNYYDLPELEADDPKVFVIE